MSALDDSVLEEEVRRAELRARLAQNLELLSEHPEKARAFDEASLQFLRNQNTVFREVNHTREAALDAVFISLYAKEKAEASGAAGDSASLKQFATALKARFGKADHLPMTQDIVETQQMVNAVPADFINWAEFGREFAHHLRRTQCPAFLNGPISIERKQRKAVERKSKKPSVPQIRPDDKPAETDVVPQRSTEKHVIEMFKKVRKSGVPEVPYINTVVDESSFCKTVENMFYMAFLVKDGRCGLHLNDHQEPVTFVPVDAASVEDGPAVEEDDSKDDDETRERKQTIFTVSYGKFCKIKERLQHPEAGPLDAAFFKTLREVEKAKYPPSKPWVDNIQTTASSKGDDDDDERPVTRKKSAPTSSRKRNTGNESDEEEEDEGRGRRRSAETDKRPRR
jgi:hypothetical protein